ncbi:hypothetical protein GCM10027270_11380 [Nocardioides ginkgobilobae]
MSQAPAGWHLQPDGRERYWDGTQWTAHFRPGPAQQAPEGQPTYYPDPTAQAAQAAQADPAQQGYPQGYAGYQQGYPQQGYGPAYPQQGYAPGYQGTPSSGSSNTTKIVLIVIGVLILVLGGGCLAVVALVGGAVNEAVETIEREDDQPGGPDNPLEITEGEAFEVSGFDYDPGWSVVGDFVDDADIEGLKLTNNRDTPRQRLRRDQALVRQRDAGHRRLLHRRGRRRHQGHRGLLVLRRPAGQLRQDHHQRHVLSSGPRGPCTARAPDQEVGGSRAGGRYWV